MADGCDKEAPPPYASQAGGAAAAAAPVAMTAMPMDAQMQMQMQALLANGSPAQQQMMFLQLQQQQQQQQGFIGAQPSAPPMATGSMGFVGGGNAVAMHALLAQANAANAMMLLPPMIGPDSAPLGTRLPEQSHMRIILSQPGPVHPKQPYTPLRIASQQEKRMYGIYVANYNWAPPVSVLLGCVPAAYKFRRGRGGDSCYCCGFDCFGDLCCACVPWGIKSPEFEAVRRDFERTFLPRAAQTVREMAINCICTESTYGAQALWDSGLIGEANTFLAPHDLYCKATRGPGAAGPTIEVYRMARDM